MEHKPILKGKIWRGVFYAFKVRSIYGAYKTTSLEVVLSICLKGLFPISVREATLNLPIHCCKTKNVILQGYVCWFKHQQKVANTKRYRFLLFNICWKYVLRENTQSSASLKQAACQQRAATGTFVGSYWFRCREGEWREEDQEGHYIIWERRESGSHRTQGDTNHHSQSLLLYTTPLYLLSILNQFVIFIQSINCYRGTWQGFAKQKETRFLQVVFPTPSSRFGKRGKEEGSWVRPLGKKAVLPQPNVL